MNQVLVGWYLISWIMELPFILMKNIFSYIWQGQIYKKKAVRKLTTFFICKHNIPSFNILLNN